MSMVMYLKVSNSFELNVENLKGFDFEEIFEDFCVKYEENEDVIKIIKQKIGLGCEDLFTLIEIFNAGKEDKTLYLKVITYDNFELILD